MQVSDVQAVVLNEPEHPGAAVGWGTGPLDVFMPDRYRRGQLTPPGTPSNVLVSVTTDTGLVGHALVGGGSPAAKAVIDYHFRSLVLGENPFDVELLWSRMYRASIPIGRRGLVIEALSAIDIALWDIIGKALGQPLFNLLGGRTSNRIRAYASQSYAREDLDLVKEEAASYIARGFTALKFRFGYGPVDGRAGMRRNLELGRAIRDAVGPDVEVMADAYMGWNVAYAIRMIGMLDELDLAWVEEPIPPDDVDGYVRIRNSVRTPIAAGEHEFTRWGFRALLEKHAVDIVQPDVDRLGGITEARKVWALAEAYDVPVIPHGGWAHNAHLVQASTNAPLLEYFPAGGLKSGYTLHRHLFKGQPEVADGWVTLSTRPGLGIELDPDELERHRS